MTRRGMAMAAVLLFACVHPGSAAAQDGTPERLGEIRWFEAPAHCTFQTAQAAEAFEINDPETWRFVFLTIMESGASAPVERGYVMTRGALRELEKVRSGLDNARRMATVWRSASAPSINVNVTLAESPAGGADGLMSGRLVLASGDGRQEVDIVGRCGG